jgi:hypothetical protein
VSGARRLDVLAPDAAAARIEYLELGSTCLRERQVQRDAGNGGIGTNGERELPLAPDLGVLIDLLP